jgi:Gram-negative bacterial TonB protein C-terminal
MKRWLMGLCGLLLAGAALADSLKDVRERVQASMLVTGSILVAPDGSVRSYTIDHPEKLPPVVVGLIDNGTKSWIFAPVLIDGQPVAARASMSLRVVAKPDGKDDYAIRVAGAQFGKDDDVEPGQSISYDSHPSPHYPEAAVRAGVWGTVYLRLLVDRQGRVENAIAEQVNMGVVASDQELDKWRNVLAEASLRTVKGWTFHIPTVGREATKDHWEARVPVNYILDGRTPRERYGKWDPYVPGPERAVPWQQKFEESSGAADAIAVGGLYQIGSGLQLTTPLNGA